MANEEQWAGLCGGYRTPYDPRNAIGKLREGDAKAAWDELWQELHHQGDVGEASYATVPLLAFTNTVWLVVLGSLLWGAAVGVQESTLRAVVADLVPASRRATAYGVFAGVLGVATLGGGALTGVLYEYSIPALIITVAAIQGAALLLLAATGIRRR